MDTVQVRDKAFRISIPEEQIKTRIRELGQQISKAYEGKKPLLLAVLNGSFIFAADLMREIATDCEISFIRVSSYEGTSSTGKVHQLLGLKEDISGRHIIIVEDIIDTGFTMAELLKLVEEKQPATVSIATLLMKPDKLQVPGLEVNYCGFRIPNDFIVGYGLDYDGEGRNLKSIYTVTDKA